MQSASSIRPKVFPACHVTIKPWLGVGEVTTLAGTGKAGFADGACDKAQFACPKAVVCTPDSLVYVADTDGHRIRCIDRKTSTVRTLAGNGESGHEDGFGEEAQLDGPRGMVHHEGKLYVSQGNHCLRCIVISTSDQFCTQSQLILSSGAVSTIAGVPSKEGYNEGLGNLAQFNMPTCLALAPQGQQLLVCDMFNHRLRAISLSDAKFTVSTLIGNGEEKSVDGPAHESSIAYPTFIVSDAAGNLYIDGKCYFDRKTGTVSALWALLTHMCVLAVGMVRTIEWLGDCSLMCYNTADNSFYGSKGPNQLIRVHTLSAKALFMPEVKQDVQQVPFKDDTGIVVLAPRLHCNCNQPVL